MCTYFISRAQLGDSFFISSIRVIFLWNSVPVVVFLVSTVRVVRVIPTRQTRTSRDCESN